ncbi:MAG: cell division protein FtsZ [Holosporaceae bacterium]|jgi:cell division protein FtsZ|nr:cell division protein FtsZ [Holosporaceae bacterium]
MATVNSNGVDAKNDSGKQGDFFRQETFAEENYLKPRITVFGVGGAGGNAVNNMIRSNLEGVDFVVANTDSQALLQSLCDRRIQLGLEITSGLGAGARPDVGRAAAEEVVEDIISYVKSSNMVFITAGMGGGTGTGAAPVIARVAKEHGVLTIGVITKPFHFEGTTRMRTAEKGIDELQQYVDTLIVIPNQNLFRVANERTTFADAFKMADDVLRSGVQGVTDLMVMPGLINLDFADIKTVMSEMGKAMMGTGDAEGDRRAIEAAEAAISNPLLDDVSMKGARGILINITGGYDMTLYEVDEAANRIREEVDPEANIIFGSTFNEKMNGRMRVSVVATGIDAAAVKQKKQAYEEKAAVRQQSEPFDQMSSVAESVQNIEDKQSQVFGVVKNNPIDREAQTTAATRKRSQSLFERLTGMRKTFSSDRKDEFTVQQPKANGTQEEDLEIPAFLRKSS